MREAGTSPTQSVRQGAEHAQEPTISPGDELSQASSRHYGSFSSEGFSHAEEQSFCHEKVLQAISTWRSGVFPDARQWLAEHPELASDKDVVLDLAYEEYCLRREAGEELPPSTFCDQFPTFQESLRDLLEVHEQIWPERPQVGDEFLGFRLIAELGRGGFSRVYLATEPALGGRYVALKVAHFGGGEALTLGRLQHPNIVPVNSVVEDAELGKTAVCMPYKGEVTLGHLVMSLRRRKSLPESAAVFHELMAQVRPRVRSELSRKAAGWKGTYCDAVADLGLQMARGLGYAHDQGVHHRDLKPSNVLLTRDGTAMLLDFNLSWDESTAYHRPGGTLPYMPPEQIQGVHFPSGEGQMPPQDARVDLFAWGVVMYELLAGVLPYGEVDLRERGAAERRLEALRQPLVPLRRLNQAVDPRLAELIEHCLNCDPEQRPASADHVVRELERYQGRTARLLRWCRRHLKALQLTSLLLAALLVFGINSFLTAPSPVARAELVARDAVARGDFATALRSLKFMLEQHPDDREARMACIRAHAARGQFLEALQEIKLGEGLEPDWKRRWQAYCKLRMDRPDEAIPLLQVLEQEGRMLVEDWVNQAVYYLSKGEWMLGLRYADEALRQRPDLVDLRVFRVRALMNLWVRDYDPVVQEDVYQELQRLLVEAPQYANLHIWAAMVSTVRNPEKPQEVLDLMREGMRRGMPYDYLHQFQELRTYVSLVEPQEFESQFQQIPRYRYMPPEPFTTW